MKYKQKKNAYFTGVWNGDTNIIIMSKHYSLESAKAQAKQDLSYTEKPARISLFKYIADLDI